MMRVLVAAWLSSVGVAGALPCRSATFSLGQKISTTADGASSVAVADLDSDQDIDILSASSDDDTIAWYENDGASIPTFARKIVTTEALGAMSIEVGDVDGDSDVDVFSANWGDDSVVWYANEGNGASWTRHVVATDVRGAYAVSSGDLDGDQHLDLLSASWSDSTLAWYRSDGGFPVPTFTKHVVTRDAIVVGSCAAADVDGDGHVDVLSASAGDDIVAWYSNDGAAMPTFWKKIISMNADGVFSSLSRQSPQKSQERGT